jgi:hypothetical protein
MTIEEKINKAERVLAYYPRPYEYRYAIVEYYCRQGKPLKVLEYYNYGEELKTGDLLKCWTHVASTNFSIVEDDFKTEEEAKQRMKELKELRK